MKKLIEALFILALLAVFIYFGRTKLSAFYYNQANNYFSQRLFNEAERAFKKSLKVNPSVAVTRYMLANTYTSLQMQDKAIEEYKKCLQIDAGYIPAYRMLSGIYNSNHLYEQASDLINQALKINPANQEIKKLSEEISFNSMAYFLDKGVDSFLAKDTKKAYELLNKAIAVKPDFAYAHYTLAFFYFHDNNLDAAENKLSDAIQIEPRFWPAHKLLGDIYFEKGLYEKAVASYKTALNFHRNDSNIENDLGLSLMQIENYDEAIPHLQEALRLDPANIDIRYSLANTCRDKKMYEDAISEYNNILRYKPDYPNIYNDLGGCLSILGKNKEALEAYQNEINYDRKKLTDNANEVIALNSLAYALNETGEYGQAKEAIDRALILQPNSRQAHLTLAKILEKSGYSKEALEELSKAKNLSSQVNFIERDIARVKRESQADLESVFIAPDTVYLKNGRQLKGRIKEEDETKIILEVKIGNTLGELIFYRNTIDKISH